MPGVVTKRFRFHNADQFKEAFGEASPTRMYAFFGRINAFDNDNSPPTPVDSVKETDFEAWRNMIHMKRIAASDVTFGVPRYNWTSGTAYHEYQSTDPDLFANTFYVLDENTYNVYKCLFNNNGGTSTVRPSGTTTTNIKTSDGYIWKYMYTIDSADVTKFVTSTHIPVSNNSTVQAAAVNGAIEVVDVIAGGTGYRANTGSFSAVSNSTVMNLAGGASSTDGFYTNSTMYISSGTGVGQLRDIIAFTGATRTATVNTAFDPAPTTGSTYIIGPKITILGDGNQEALAYANTVAGGAIINIEVTATGNNYSFANVAITSNGGSSGAAIAYVSPEGGHGSHPQRELGGYNVILSSQLSGNVSNTFVTNNDFRVIGIVNNPIERASNTVALTTQYDQTTKLVLSSVSGDFTSDEIVVSNRNATGRVVRFANSNASGTAGTLTLSNLIVNANGNSFTVADTLEGNSSSVTATITSVTDTPIVPFTGEIIYRENRSPVSRAETQTEDIKLVVKF